MSSEAVIVLRSARDRELVKRWVDEAPTESMVRLRGPRRTLEQNKRLWAMLTDVARQAEWHGKRRTTAEWKDLFTGAYKTAQGGLEAVPGLEGGFMILGLHTSELSVREMTELQDYIEAWGAQHGVVFSGPDAPKEEAE